MYQKLNGKNLNNIRDIIKEFLYEQYEDSEAPKDEVFGKYAFADQRKDVPIEKNTTIEQDLYEKIYEFLNSSSHLEDENVINVLKHILSKGYYNKIIHAPINKNVYRGIVVSEKYLKRFLNIENLSNEGYIKNSSFNYNPSEYNSTYKFSSWSTDIYVAFNFVKSSKIIEKYDLILTANVLDNKHKFITGPDGLYKVTGFNTYSHENEVIGLNEIIVSEVRWSINEKWEWQNKYK